MVLTCFQLLLFLFTNNKTTSCLEKKCENFFMTPKIQNAQHNQGNEKKNFVFQTLQS